jgi:hypothetical protein
LWTAVHARFRRAQACLESSRNWPDTTTFWPASSPERISVRPFASMPVCTSTGANLPSGCARSTTLRLPVWIHRLGRHRQHFLRVAE